MQFAQRNKDTSRHCKRASASRAPVPAREAGAPPTDRHKMAAAALGPRGRQGGRALAGQAGGVPKNLCPAPFALPAFIGQGRCQSRASAYRQRSSPDPAPGGRAPLLGKLTAWSAVWSAALPGSVVARPQPPGAVELEVERQWCERSPKQQQQYQQERWPLDPLPPPMEASLTCAVCLSLLEEPVTLPLCSHNFCRGCVLECLASAEAARLQQLQRNPGQARLGRGAPGPGPGPGPSCSRVPCPLCRKLCLLPRGGVAALPVNTTLAEVVKLYRSGAAGAAAAGEATLGPKPGSDLLSLQAFGGSCQKHPSRPVQLYCRMCRQAGCGQCVSEEHQGIFHSVNLIDTVYQEEKVSAAPLLALGAWLGGWAVHWRSHGARVVFARKYGKSRGAVGRREAEGLCCFGAVRVCWWPAGLCLSRLPSDCIQRA